VKKYLSDIPKLASQWHPTKNGDKRPEDFPSKSNQIVWWKCPKGDDHEWDAIISNRNRKSGHRCPFCSGKRVSKTNNLLVVNPKLASQWHPTKNGDKRPEHFTTGSDEKVWWKCPKGDDHEWQTSINNRKVNSCRFCAGSSTSKPEIRILCELRYLFGFEEVEWRNKIHDEEIDIFLCQHNIGIEYDGFHWHQGKLQSDIKKDEFFQKKGIKMIRVREHPLQVISKNNVIVKQKSLTKDNLNTLILKIKAGLKPPLKIDFDDYISNCSFLNEKEYERFISFLPSPPLEYSILITHPEVAKQWDYEKNGHLRPEHYSHGSDEKVWWKCPKGDDHEWYTNIHSRCAGHKCPFCGKKKASKTDNLLLHNPKLASEWHPTKNGDKRPEEYRPFSRKRVWWKCPKGDDHEWQATISNRSIGRGCRVCSRVASKTINLLVVNPKLASEWHPTKNGDKRPEEYRPHSNEKVWWKCPKGDDHEWQAKINNRSNGRGCRFCYEIRRSKTKKSK